MRSVLDFIFARVYTFVDMLFVSICTAVAIIYGTFIWFFALMIGLSIINAIDSLYAACDKEDEKEIDN